jgi:hypothetical protein
MKNMKQFLLSIILLAGFSVTAQTDFRFADSTAQWNVLDHPIFDCLGPCTKYYTHIYTVGTDSVVNGVRYQTILGDTTMNNPAVTCIRKDSLGRVYKISMNDTLEELIYDFSKQTGDTFSINDIFGGSDIKCHVDSTGFINMVGIRKVLYITYNMDNWKPDIWVEGIGSIYSHLIHPGIDHTLWDGSWYSLLCYSENGNLVYHDTAFSTCVLNTNISSSVNKVSNAGISIVPNPVTQSQFTVTLSETPKPNTIFMLYDAVGCVVRRDELNSINQTIYTSGLANGIYTYVIDANKVKSGSGKLVVAK